ncbi:MAG: transporter substrate-binding domain-containing protein [Alphaproteobacteria bacterium]|nr:transporter substrate-binding domain-containing protein [Alphaproteobacteria bacterium]
MQILSRLAALAGAGAIIAALGAAPAAAQGQPPLRCAVDGTFAPHAMPRMGGGVEGFQIDLFQEVARRMGRQLTIDSASFSGLIPALNAGRYDFLCAPTTVTRERAENLLFTEGYLYTYFQFITRRGGVELRTTDDLRGKRISVNKGSAYDTWAQANAQRYGFTVQTYDTQPDAVQAVLAGRADANLGGNTVVAYVVKSNRQLQLSLALNDTRAHWGAPFRKDSTALRNQVEAALECMKRDGFIARIYEQWFGAAPPADDAARVSFPGFGVPGLPGYDATPHTPRCS